MIAPGQAGTRPAHAGHRPGYILALLSLSYLMAMFDRQILILLAEPIKAEMGVSDVQLSLLNGFWFAAFYAVLGLAFGRFVDRVVRTRLLAGAILLWSAATFASGLVQGYTGLVLARMLVGVGEAALAPVAYSLISEIFPRERHTRAFAIYTMGLYLGAGLAFILGSRILVLLGDLDAIAVPIIGEVPGGWRATFLIAGLPGIVLAGLLAVVREPRHETWTPPSSRYTTRRYLGHVARNWRPYLAHHVGIALIAGFGQAKALWLPAFFHRVHDWSVPEVGMLFGLILLLICPIGSLMGSAIVARLQAAGRNDAPLVACAGVCLADIAFTALAVLAHSPAVAIVGTALTFCVLPFTGGPGGAALQVIAPAGARGQAGAIFVLAYSMIGISTAPLIVALITTHVFGDPAMVGNALLATAVITMLPAFVLLWWGRRFFRAG